MSKTLDAIWDRMVELHKFSSYIAELHFGIDIDDKRTALILLAYLVSHQHYMEDPERIRRYLEDLPVDAAAGILADEIAKYSGTDEAAQASAWFTGTGLAVTKRALLLQVANWVNLVGYVAISAHKQDVHGAIDMAITASISYGRVLALHQNLLKKIDSGSKGAKKRGEILRDRKAKALEMYDTLSLSHLSAIGAAEQLRRKGAPVSIDKLAREISSLRRERDLRSKTRVEDSRARTADTKNPSHK